MKQFPIDSLITPDALRSAIRILEDVRSNTCNFMVRAMLDASIVENQRKLEELTAEK